MLNGSGVDTSDINAASFLQIGGGIVLSFVQDVQVFHSATGQLVSIVQNVKSTGLGQLVSIAQQVKLANADNFYYRNKWRATVYINNKAVPDNQLSGEIIITKTENDSNTMEFTIIPTRGSQTLVNYEGQAVYCIVETPDLGAIRVFTGTIDIPTIDLISRNIKIRCTNNRRLLLNSQAGAWVNYIGVYDPNIFGLAVDTADELDKRLETTPLTISFDSYNNAIVSSCFAKGSADFIVNDVQTYRDAGRDIQILLNPRSKVVNTVNMTYKYRRQRLYHQETSFSWTAPYAGNACLFLANGYTVCPRNLVTAAIQAAGWPVHDPVTFLADIKGGYYNCPNGEGGTESVGYSTGSVTVATSAVTNTVLNSDLTTTTTNVVDAQGNQVFQTVPVSGTNVAGSLCTGAYWTATTRWAQNVEEEYFCVVQAPQSVAQFGPVSQSESAGVESTFNVKDWTTYKAYEAPPVGSVTIPAQPATSYYIDDKSNLGDFARGISCMLNKAYTTILKAHRDNRVIFNCKITPNFEVYQTLEVSATSSEGTIVDAKGKAYQIEHRLDVMTGESNTKVELVLSVTTGSTSQTPITIPAPPTGPPPTWQANHAYVLDDIININGYNYECTVAGTSGSTQPIFPTVTVGDTVTDNAVTWGLQSIESGTFTVWVANSPYAAGDIVTSSKLNGFGYKALNAGTSGATEPVWPVENVGQTVTDIPTPPALDSIVWVLEYLSINSVFSSLNSVTLDTHYGEVPNPAWSGFVGNMESAKNVGGTKTYTHTNYPVSFTVDTPSIPLALTNNLTLFTSPHYNVAVVNDTLTVTL